MAKGRDYREMAERFAEWADLDFLDDVDEDELADLFTEWLAESGRQMSDDQFAEAAVFFGERAVEPVTPEDNREFRFNASKERWEYYVEGKRQSVRTQSSERRPVESVREMFGMRAKVWHDPDTGRILTWRKL